MQHIDIKHVCYIKTQFSFALLLQSRSFTGFLPKISLARFNDWDSMMKRIERELGVVGGGQKKKTMLRR